MAIKNIFARGIGFTEGVVSWLVTRGYSIGSAPPGPTLNLRIAATKLYADNGATLLGPDNGLAALVCDAGATWLGCDAGRTTLIPD